MGEGVLPAEATQHGNEDVEEDRPRPGHHRHHRGSAMDYGIGSRTVQHQEGVTARAGRISLTPGTSQDWEKVPWSATGSLEIARSNQQVGRGTERVRGCRAHARAPGHMEGSGILLRELGADTPDS